MFVLGRAASVRPPSFALYLVKVKVGIIGVLFLKQLKHFLFPDWKLTELHAQVKVL